MLPFFIAVALLTAVLPAAVKGAVRQGWIDATPSLLYQSTWLVAFVTAVIYYYLYRWGKRSTFVHLYLLSMVLKLIAYVIYALLMIMHDRDGAAPNVLYFMGIYFIFTGVEIGFLYRRISRSSPS